MNKQNFEIARINTKVFENVEVFQKAIWNKTGEIEYDAQNQSDAYSISMVQDFLKKNIEKVSCISIPNLLDTYKIKKTIF
jgi:hypothetical protein